MARVFILDLAIYHRKSNDTALAKPSGFQLEFFGDEDYTEEVVIRPQEISSISELEEGLSYRQRVANLLKEGAMNVTEIATALDLPYATITTTLNRGKGKYFVRAEGGWGLLSSDNL